MGFNFESLRKCAGLLTILPLSGSLRPRAGPPSQAANLRKMFRSQSSHRARPHPAFSAQHHST